MTSKKSSPFSAGLSSALAFPRLAGVLWLLLAAVGLLVYVALKGAVKPFDDGPFREAILQGWSSWGMASWIGFKSREMAVSMPVIYFCALVFFLLHLYVTAGVLRVLVLGVHRPVLRRVLSEGASLFRPTLWATLRFAISLAFWEALLVAAPLSLFEKLAGDDPIPNDVWAVTSELWTVVVGAIVLFNVMARYDLARIALAKDDAPTARGAYRVAKERLRGARPSAIGLLLAWLVVSAVLQVLFTNLGIRMNPSTGAGLALFVVVRQLGFFLLAMSRVGFWGALLAWEEARRPVPLPMPVWKPWVPEKVAAPEPAVLEPAVEPAPEDVPAPPQEQLG